MKENLKRLLKFFGESIVDGVFLLIAAAMYHEGITTDSLSLKAIGMIACAGVIAVIRFKAHRDNQSLRRDVDILKREVQDAKSNGTVD